jgi:ribosomal protein L35
VGAQGGGRDAAFKRHLRKGRAEPQHRQQEEKE